MPTIRVDNQVMEALKQGHLEIVHDARCSPPREPQPAIAALKQSLHRKADRVILSPADAVDEFRTDEGTLVDISIGGMSVEGEREMINLEWKESFFQLSLSLPDVDHREPDPAPDVAFNMFAVVRAAETAASYTCLHYQFLQPLPHACTAVFARLQLLHPEHLENAAEARVFPVERLGQAEDAMTKLQRDLTRFEKTFLGFLEIASE